ncbi:MAG: co-chaperone GroES [Firmicutes bacterium]|nr:co-chaperone GroES [Bacillota bacterium]
MIRPLGDNVVIKRLEAEEKTKGGIILSSAAKEVPQVAEVLAVGPGTADVDMMISVGEKVIFKKYGGTEIEYNGEELIILPYNDILAVLD